MMLLGTPPSIKKRLPQSRPLDIALYSHRSDSFDFADLVDADCRSIGQVDGFGSIEAFKASRKTYDVALVCNHIMDEHLIHLSIQASRPNLLIVSWTFDNHHHEPANVATTEFADLVLPAHSDGCNALEKAGRTLGLRFPLASRQWTRWLAHDVVRKAMQAPRSDLLYGGYFKHGAGSRSSFLEEIASRMSPTTITLRDPAKRGEYFDRGRKWNLREWCSYKVHLSMPLINDLSTRCFDSLLCGQIPLVPSNCSDLDRYISQDMQQQLPIVRYNGLTLGEIEQAYRTALARFDSDGSAGVMRRHRFAVKKHHIAVRIGEIATYLQDLAR